MRKVMVINMKYFVNENCIGCGLCTEICPDVFSLNEEGVSVAVEGDIAPELEKSANEALESCPVSAIEKES